MVSRPFVDLVGDPRCAPCREQAEIEADREAIRRTALGDPEALAQLYDRRGWAVYGLALRILGDALEAEEVVQDVFAQAWRQAPRYDTSRGVVIAWLQMMARSRAIDRLRLRRSLPPLAPEGWKLLDDLRDPGGGPEAATLTAERLADVRTALRQLPRVQQATITLAYCDGLTHAEIAERLAQPLGTVKTRIRQGLIRLRRAVAEAQASRAGTTGADGPRPPRQPQPVSTA